MKLIRSSKTDYLFVADSGPGKQSGKGLIVPWFGKTPEQHVAVSLTWRAVNELLLTTAAHYQAWLSAKYLADWTQFHAPRLAGKTWPGREFKETAPPPMEPPPMMEAPPAIPVPQPPSMGFGSVYGRENGSIRADDKRIV